MDRLRELATSLYAQAWHEGLLIESDELTVEVEIRADVELSGIDWTVCIDGETTATHEDLGVAIEQAVSRHLEKVRRT